MDEEIKNLGELIDKQANDEGLWSIPYDRLQTISEAYLQQELRKLHAAVEDCIKSFQKGKKK